MHQGWITCVPGCQFLGEFPKFQQKPFTVLLCQLQSSIHPSSRIEQAHVHMRFRVYWFMKQNRETLQTKELLKLKCLYYNDMSLLDC